MPGRTSGTSLSNTTFTSKFVCPSTAAAALRFAVLPISVTVPTNDVSGSASTVIFAAWPSRMYTPPATRRARQRVPRDLRRLAEPHVHDVRLVDVRAHEHPRHVGDHEDLRT